MKGLFFIALFIFGLTTTGYSQYLKAKDSDPDALALLTKASKSFSGTNNVKVDFRVRTSIPGQIPVTNEGVLYQGGTSYRVELKDYNIISNGTTRWVYLKGPNEVNIYNESNGKDWVSPNDFLSLHTSPDLVFTLQSSKNGISIIEAKPLKGRFDEYSKFVIGITHDKLSYINALSSDGSRQEMSIHSVTMPTTWDAAKLFTFNKDSHPGVYVEDLRLD